MADSQKRKLVLINKAALDELVSLQDAIAIVDAAMREYSAGKVGSPQRAVLNVSAATRMGLMPGTMPSIGRFGLKVVSLSSEAPKFGLYSHQGMMILFDDATGQPLCMVECHALTRLRTAAASAVATRALSRPDSKNSHHYRRTWRSGGAAYRCDLRRAPDRTSDRLGAPARQGRSLCPEPAQIPQSDYHHRSL